jgi:hypothetical protein
MQVGMLELPCQTTAFAVFARTVRSRILAEEEAPEP